MEHPEIWYYFCKFLHQDFLNMYGSLDEGISAFTQSIEAVQRTELVEHLNFLVSSELTEDQLFEEWDRSGAQIAPSGDSMRNMLRLFIDSLENTEIQH